MRDLKASPCSIHKGSEGNFISCGQHFLLLAFLFSSFSFPCFSSFFSFFYFSLLLLSMIVADGRRHFVRVCAPVCVCAYLYLYLYL